MEIVDFYKTMNDGICRVNESIMNLPTVTAEPKKGHWEYVQYDGNPKIGNWHCSECRRVVFLLKSQKSGETPLYDYCPWCGARMESETEQGLSYADKDTLMPAT